jgi:hypothetical protein
MDGSAKDGGVRQGRRGPPRTKGNAKDERERQGRKGTPRTKWSDSGGPFHPLHTLQPLVVPSILGTHLLTLWHTFLYEKTMDRSAKDGRVRQGRRGPPRTEGSAKDGGVRQGRRGPPRTEGSAKDKMIGLSTFGIPFHPWHTLHPLVDPFILGTHLLTLWHTFYEKTMDWSAKGGRVHQGWKGPPRVEGSTKGGRVHQGRKGTPRTKGNAKVGRVRQGRKGPPRSEGSTKVGRVRQGRKGPPRSEGSAKVGRVRQGRKGPPRTK